MNLLVHCLSGCFFLSPFSNSPVNYTDCLTDFTVFLGEMGDRDKTYSPLPVDLHLLNKSYFILPRTGSSQLFYYSCYGLSNCYRQARNPFVIASNTRSISHLSSSQQITNFTVYIRLHLGRHPYL